MSMVRRTSTDSRRRRILMYQYSREGERGASSDRRLVEKLRQARRPASIYGSSVRRRLRGRWYSLVPVRRRAMAAVSVTVLGAALLLCLTHWFAITWPPLAYREPLARAFRLDRPDSFGTWFRSLLLALTAGVALLVYQLRRYRNDDYRGSYRIWPPVIVLIALASLDTVVALVPWGGELIDTVLGKRIAMAGADWIRIGLTVGGAALALRMVAEVRHSKLAVALMLVAVAWFALPVAGRWGILLSDTPLKWWLITSAPLLAAATLCLACTAYLRMLFREVRGLDQDDRLADRLQQWKANLLASRQAKQTDDARPAKPAAEKPQPTRAAKATKTAAAASEPAADDQASAAPADGEKPAAKRSFKERLQGISAIRRYFKLPQRAATSKPAEDATNSEPDLDQDSQALEPPSTAPKAAAKSAPEPRKSAAQPTAKPNSALDEPDDSASPSADEKPARRGLGSLFARWRRSPQAAEDETDASEVNVSEQAAKSPAKPKAEPVARSAAAPADDRDEDDSNGESDDSIDWASMNKAERRRLKRELRRSGDAA